MLWEEGAIIEVRRIVAVGRRGYSPERPMEARRYQFIDPLWVGLGKGYNPSPIASVRLLSVNTCNPV